MSYPVLAPVSEGYPKAQGRLLTCYSPVRRSSTPKGAFPLDLHVLSTPPAFVLSQDQTLQQKPNLSKNNPGKQKTFAKTHPTPPKSRARQTTIGTGLQSTLLSSQRTTTHQKTPKPVRRALGHSFYTTVSFRPCQPVFSGSCRFVPVHPPTRARSIAANSK